MIACYAWTDIQIINIVNVRMHSFEKEEADLFICTLERVNEDLLAMIAESGCFRNVYRVPVVGALEQGGKRKRMKDKLIPYGKGISVVLYRKKIYKEYYKYTVGKTIYEWLLVPGYWGEVLYLLEHLLQYKKDIRIAFIDEGSRHYSATLEILCRNQPCGGFRQTIIKALIMGKYYGMVDKLPCRLYLYEPRARRYPIELQVLRIPKIKKENVLCYRCMSALGERQDMTEYQRRKVIFFPIPDIGEYTGGKTTTKQILDVVLEKISGNKLLGKVHPTELRQNAQSNGGYPANMYLDVRKLLFESVVVRIDMEEKVLISRNTSCFLTPKYVFDLEPILIFIHQLYPNRRPMENHDMDIYVDGLREMYRDKWKVMNVSSLKELRLCLEKIHADNND